MNSNKLNRILDKHRKWLNHEEGGARVDLSYSDLRGSDLRHSNLSGSDLRYSDLIHSNLSGSDLRDSGLDYSCLPLWCGSLRANFDDCQLKQIAYHLVKAGLQSNNASDETKAELAKLVDFANGFHKADECGKITLDA